MKRWRIPALAALLVLSALSHNSYLISLAVVIGLQAMPAIGLALIAGYTGQISLGHAAFYGLGAYGAALIGKWLGIPAWLDVMLATALVALLAWTIGWLVFRLKGHYLAMATLAFGIIVQVGFVELRDVTGGPNGLTGIPPLAVFGHALDSDLAFLPAVWIVTIATIVGAENLIASPTGLEMLAISESEHVARSVGTNVQSVKRLIMMVSGLCCALGGSLYAHYVGYLSPGPFDVGFSVKLLLMVAIGGFADVWGVVFGVIFITIVGELLKPLGAYDVVAYGVLLVVSVIYCPNGLLRGASTLARSSLRMAGEARVS
ncbi:MAG TPA: branched-chain amino acid ABC transporter permease [Bradyrhizobium sp.]|nr:branched-chain amino acid ABC transporter permease [Bradyrhizobium sp.]